MPQTTREMLMRQKKVGLLANAAQRFLVANPEFDVSWVRIASDEEWGLIAQLATQFCREVDPKAPVVHPPHSQETKDMVIAELKLRGVRDIMEDK